MYCQCGIRVKFFIGRDGKPGYNCSTGSCRFVAMSPMQAEGYRRYVPTTSSSTATNTTVVSFEATLHPVDKVAPMIAAQLITPQPVNPDNVRRTPTSNIKGLMPSHPEVMDEEVWKLLCGYDYPNLQAQYMPSRDCFIFPLHAYKDILANLLNIRRKFTSGNASFQQPHASQTTPQLFIEEIPPFFFNSVTAMTAKGDAHRSRVESRLSQNADAEDTVFRQLKPFQKTGVEFIINHGGRGMIADEMGLGKTIQAIAVAHHYRDEWPVLVVCPSSLTENWLKEFIQWCGLPASRIGVLQGSKARPSPLHSVVIASYSSLMNAMQPVSDTPATSSTGKKGGKRGTGASGSIKKGPKKRGRGISEDDDDDDTFDLFENEENNSDCAGLGVDGDSFAGNSGNSFPNSSSSIMANSTSAPIVFKVVILDESHYIKTANSQRTKLALQVCRTAQRVVLLSGTPAMSRPSELYSQLQAIQPQGLPTRTQYSARYCNGYVGRFGLDTSGHSNLNELHMLLRHFIIRRTKQQVLDELPNKTRQLLYIRVTDKEKKGMEKSVLALRKSVDSNRLQPSDAARNSARNADGTGATDDQNGPSGSVVRAPNAFELKCATARAKIPAVTEYVKDIIEQYVDSGEKLILFAHHQVMIQALHDTVKRMRPTRPLDFILIAGDTPVSQREALADHFRKSPSCHVAILSMQSSGTGHNFTCASTVIFTELDWNPSTHLQCEDRVHRIGQVSSCTIKYLLADGTTDSVVWPLLQEKLSVTTAALDDLTGDQVKLLSSGSDKQHVARSLNTGDVPQGRLQATLDTFVFSKKETDTDVSVVETPDRGTRNIGTTETEVVVFGSGKNSPADAKMRDSESSTHVNSPTRRSNGGDELASATPPVISIAEMEEQLKQKLRKYGANVYGSTGNIGGASVFGAFSSPSTQQQWLKATNSFKQPHSTSSASKGKPSLPADAVDRIASVPSEKGSSSAQAASDVAKQQVAVPRQASLTDMFKQTVSNANNDDVIVVSSASSSSSSSSSSPSIPRLGLQVGTRSSSHTSPQMQQTHSQIHNGVTSASPPSGVPPTGAAPEPLTTKNPAHCGPTKTMMTFGQRTPIQTTTVDENPRVSGEHTATPPRMSEKFHISFSTRSSTSSVESKGMDTIHASEVASTRSSTVAPPQPLSPGHRTLFTGISVNVNPPRTTSTSTPFQPSTKPATLLAQQTQQEQQPQQQPQQQPAIQQYHNKRTFLKFN